MEESKIKSALSVVDQALDLAARKGVFGLKDATVIDQALSFLQNYLKIEDAPALSESVQEPSK